MVHSYRQESLSLQLSMIQVMASLLVVAGSIHPRVLIHLTMPMIRFALAKLSLVSYRNTRRANRYPMVLPTSALQQGVWNSNRPPMTG